MRNTAPIPCKRCGHDRPYNSACKFCCKVKWDGNRICEVCGSWRSLAKGYCNECARVRANQWYENNREVALAYFKDRRLDPAFRERNRTYQQLWARQDYAKDPTSRRASARRYQVAHPEKVREMAQRWYLANRDKLRVRQIERRAANRMPHALHEQKRRAAKRNNGGRGYTLTDWNATVERQRGRCFDCGDVAKLTVGHLVPLCKGGPHDPDNIVAQCWPCNRAQGTKLHPKAQVAA